MPTDDLSEFGGDGKQPEDDYAKQRRLMWADVDEGVQVPIRGGNLQEDEQ